MLEETFVATVPKGRIYGTNGLVITPCDRAVEETVIEWIPCAKKHSIFSQFKLPKSKKEPSRVAVIAGKSAYCYYHWMFDLLPRLEVLRLSEIPYDKLVVNPVQRPFQGETLRLLGIEVGEAITSHSQLHLVADEVVIPSLPAKPGHIPRWVCDFLRRLFLPQQAKGNTPVTGLRLYITRRKAPARMIANEPALLEVLTRYGCEEVILEEIPVVEQAALFAAAELVVAPHGAGLTNLVFCGPGAAVIELFTPDWIHGCYWRLSHQVGLEHHCIMGSQEGLSLPQLKNHDMWIDCEAVASCIASIFNKKIIEEGSESLWPIDQVTCPL